MLGIVGGLVVLVVAGLLYLSRGLNQGASITIDEIDISSLPDGIYEGTYRAGRWTNTVEVDVADGRMTAIRVVKDVQFALAEVRKQTIDRVLEKQSPAVDAVSGATVTSKAYLKAVEKALATKD
ncbi:MAG: FMN-binding protein [Limnochordia bacterium]|nr:FMN-binding protein [Limnochordia bacterium]MDD2630109.1 FMN-binding protein [Limnochordia bacterium]